MPLHAGAGRTIAAALGRTIAAALGRSVDYVENPDKTESGELITAYECDPLIAAQEFAFSKRQYAALTGRDQGDRDVIAYHLRQSFKPGEIDPANANQIGYDLAMSLTKGQHAFLVCTHVDKAHVHSHIIFNSTSLDCDRKFRNFIGSSFAVRRISDRLCAEHGLSIIENPKPSRGSYGTWLGDAKPLSQRDTLRSLIDGSISVGASFKDFLAVMERAGCDVKQGKHLAFKLPGAQKFIRSQSLGDDYTEDAIRERISSKRIIIPKRKYITAPTAPIKPNLIIDIEAKLQQARSPGYEHWARLYNLKESAKTLIFLKERGLDNYDLLVAKTDAAKNIFHSGEAAQQTR